MREQLNASPWFKAAVLIFMLVLGPFLVRKGLRGIRDKRITGKYGRVYTGNMAVISGGLFVVTGIVMVAGAIVLGARTFLVLP